MDISHKLILNKIDEKVKAAKAASSTTQLREHVIAVKTLCELLLDSPESDRNVGGFEGKTNNPIPLNAPSSVEKKQVLTFSEKKLETDDGANGDSIFDF